MKEFHLHGCLNISMCFHVEAESLEAAQKKVGEILSEVSNKAQPDKDDDEDVTFEIPAPIVDVTLMVTPELIPVDELPEDQAQEIKVPKHYLN